MMATNIRQIDSPASETYDKFTPDQIKAFCELDMSMNRMFRIMPAWETLLEGARQTYRLKAYWTLRGAIDPMYAAMCQLMDEEPYDEKWHAECVARGWVGKDSWRAETLLDLEKKFLPPPIPSIHSIIKRCPQMAIIYALRGAVSEPYWWAALSITEHASPNYSKECSDGYAGFSEEELNSRIARIYREKTKPALCTRLDSVNPNVCTVCKFQGTIRTPIALGFQHEPKSGKLNHE
jgi:hypothetical protein